MAPEYYQQELSRRAVSLGSYDMFLTKYDTAGNKKWTEQLGSVNSDSGQGVTVDSDGNVYVTGDTHGSLDGNTNMGEADIFLSKYDTAGIGYVIYPRH
jgi:hypothetical protein